MFIGSCAGTFYSLNKSTGAVQWSYDIRKDGRQTSFHGNPLIIDDLVLIGTDLSCAPDGIGHVYSFERNTGKVRWKYQTTSVPTDILRIGPNVYFGSFQDRWSAVDLKTGKLVWSFSTGTANPDCTMVKSPVADGDHIYLTGLDGFIYSLDTATGQVIWKRKLTAPPSTALALIDDALLVGTSDNHIYRLKSATGATVADLAVEATPVGRLSLTDDALLLFLESRNDHSGYIVSVDPNLTTQKWKQKSSPDWASERPHVWKGLVLAGNCRGELGAFRASDGAAQWKLNLKGCIRSIGSSDDMLFVGVQEGTVYALGQ